MFTITEKQALSYEKYPIFGELKLTLILMFCILSNIKRTCPRFSKNQLFLKETCKTLKNTNLDSDISDFIEDFLKYERN